MCNIYTFYHLCGHTYLRTLISCTTAVDRAAAAANRQSNSSHPPTPKSTGLSFPHLMPLPLSAPSTPPSAYIYATNPSPTPLLLPTPLLPLLPPPTTPSSSHLRTIYPCPHTPNATSIVPTNCGPCTAINSLQSSLSAHPEDRATVSLVSAVRKAELQNGEGSVDGRGRRRAQSEVASPDRVMPVDEWGIGFGNAVESVELLRPVRFEGGEKRVREDGHADWGKGWRGRLGSDSSKTEGTALMGHSVTASRRRGVDAKARIVSARKRVVSGFGPGW